MDLVKLAKNCYFDSSLKKIYYNKEEIVLTRSQMRLLDFLVQNLGKSVASVDIYFYVWNDYSKEYNEKSIRNLVSKTRKELPFLNIQNIYGGYYMLRQGQELPDSDFQDYLLDILDQSQNAIVITDPNQKDNPIIYINQAYTQLFGYYPEDALGKNCRFMHGKDDEQLALIEIKNAISNETKLTVNIRNYTKAGKLVHNQLSISPIFDKKTGLLKYFLGIHKDVTYINKLIKFVKELS
ncbi:MAG: PAS domain-containing protein [Campylobacterota bacterium]